MGKIFTPEQLEQGRVPELGAHEKAAEFVCEQLFFDQNIFDEIPQASSMERDNVIIAGLVHGSSTHGTTNIRSDLDNLLIVDSSCTSFGSATLAEITSHVFREAYRRFNVEVESNRIEVGDIARRHHRIDPVFLNYLLRAEENPDFSWNSPATMIRQGFSEEDFQPVNLADVLCRYTADKIAKFDKAMNTEEMDYHAMQRAFELPKNLARKVLSALDPDFSVQAASTQEILDGMLEFYNSQVLAAGRSIGNLETLVSLDREYSELLDDITKGRKSIGDYTAWITRCYRPAILLAAEGTRQYKVALDTHLTSLEAERTYNV